MKRVEGRIKEASETRLAAAQDGTKKMSGAADILYVHPSKQEVNAKYDRYIPSPVYPIIPVGLVGLANMLLDEGLTVRGVNLPLEFLLNVRFDLVAWLRSQGQPRLILVDLHWYEHCFGALDVARACKQVYPDTPVALGGLTATRFAGEILARFPEVDYVIRGDAETPLRMLAAAHEAGIPDDGALSRIPNLTYRAHGKVEETAQEYVAGSADLDRLDLVGLDFLEHSQAYRAIQYTGAGFVKPGESRLLGHWLSNGRGCTYNCSYCGGSRSAHKALAGREGVTLRSPERTVEDIARLKALGVHQVALALDPAIMGEEYWRPLLSATERRGLRMGIYNEFFQLPSPEFLRTLAPIADPRHSEVALSPLSGSEAVRRLNGKQYGNAELLACVDQLRDYGLPLYVYFSLNLPGETQGTFRETLQLAEEICQRYPPHLLRMINKCHTIDPQSPMGEDPIQYGLRREYLSFMDYYRYCEQTAWQARRVTRGTLRGYTSKGLRPQQVEKMARSWDSFAQRQQARCFPVPRGW